MIIKMKVGNTYALKACPHLYSQILDALGLEDNQAIQQLDK